MLKQLDGSLSVSIAFIVGSVFSHGTKKNPRLIFPLSMLSCNHTRIKRSDKHQFEMNTGRPMTKHNLISVFVSKNLRILVLTLAF